MGRFTKMRDRNDQELIDGIERAKEECSRAGLDFYTLLAGVDSYFEQRRRKDEAKAYGQIPDTTAVDPRSPAWGNPSGTEPQQS